MPLTKTKGRPFVVHLSMNKRKIFNDPVYGFISIPSDLIFDLIQHPYVQRLRRISQLGLTHLTYPGALHTRFHHALGAMHLMSLAIDQLRLKGTDITEEEAEAVFIAILLHDMGHGPFSHALEKKLIAVDHEVLSLALMEELNRVFNGKLDTAIRIFSNQYPKSFLHELISGQLDMDRMDYLNRDSFYSGVMEGKIGYDRIIKMLRVQDDQLVVEEKGIYSIEKFLVARKIMYWQVYLHKTVLASELMLIAVVKRVRELLLEGISVSMTEALRKVIKHSWEQPADRKELLDAFVLLDDHDIMILLKEAMQSPDFLLRFLSTGLIDRRLFVVELSKNAFVPDRIDDLVDLIMTQYDISETIARQLIWEGKEETETYDEHQGEIRLMRKNGDIVLLSDMIDHGPFTSRTSRHYLCYPKIVR